MLTLKLIVPDNWATMVRVEDTLKRQLGDAVKFTADAIAADIMDSWSATHQTVRSGSPPAIDSGVLNDSIVVDDQGRNDTGQFANKDMASVWYIRVDTSDNDPGGYNYAQVLEDPDAYDLPFIAPALERAEGYYTSNIKRFVRL